MARQQHGFSRKDSACPGAQRFDRDGVNLLADTARQAPGPLSGSKASLNPQTLFAYFADNGDLREVPPLRVSVARDPARVLDFQALGPALNVEQ
jgi:hypothetical protein